MKTLAGISLLTFALAAFAQIEQANITGTVSDATGAVVPDAVVRVTNIRTKVTAETRSNQSGAYRLPYLSSGDYELSVEKEGFGFSRVTDIRLTVGLTATVNVSLRTGSLQQEVTVSATAVQLEQASPTLGNVVDA